MGSFSTLTDITASCQHLEYLSIAHVGQQGHAGSLSYLKQALQNCKKLVTFRYAVMYRCECFTIRLQIADHLFSLDVGPMKSIFYLINEACLSVCLSVCLSFCLSETSTQNHLKDYANFLHNTHAWKL